jgi:hypothetical protein
LEKLHNHHHSKPPLNLSLKANRLSSLRRRNRSKTRLAFQD